MELYVWVVEMQGRKKWSKVAVALSRTDAVRERLKWEARNPSDKFRTVKYIPARTLIATHSSKGDL